MPNGCAFLVHTSRLRLSWHAHTQFDVAVLYIPSHLIDIKLARSLERNYYTTTIRRCSFKLRAGSTQYGNSQAIINNDDNVSGHLHCGFAADCDSQLHRQVSHVRNMITIMCVRHKTNFTSAQEFRERSYRVSCHVHSLIRWGLIDKFERWESINWEYTYPEVIIGFGQTCKVLICIGNYYEFICSGNETHEWLDVFGQTLQIKSNISTHSTQISPSMHLSNIRLSSVFVSYRLKTGKIPVSLSPQHSATNT